MRCTRHNAPNCGRLTACIQERRDSQSRAASRAAVDPLADPTSLTHQATYGGAFYGTVDTGPSSSPSSDCSPPSSSSYDSGSSSSSSYDSGSSSSSSDCGGGW